MKRGDQQNKVEAFRSPNVYIKTTVFMVNANAIHHDPDKQNLIFYEQKASKLTIQSSTTYLDQLKGTI